MAVKLGINPIGWSNDDMRELGGDIPLATCLRQARAAGFEGVELGHKFPNDAKTLGQILSSYDLSLVSGWYSTNLLVRDVDEEMEAVRSHASLLRDMGCDTIIVAETSNSIHGDRSVPLAESPKISSNEMEMLAGRLEDFAFRMRAFDLKTAYHHHMGTCVETVDEIDALMDASGSDLGLLLDTGHCLFGGGDPVDLAHRYRDRIVHVHCKDIRRSVMQRVTAERMSFLDAVVEGVFTVPGDGCIDYPPVLALVAAAGYGGWIVVEAEQDPEQADPEEYAALGYKNLRAYAAEAGLF